MIQWHIAIITIKLKCLLLTWAKEAWPPILEVITEKVCQLYLFNSDIMAMAWWRRVGASWRCTELWLCNVHKISNRDQCLMETMCDCNVNKLTWLRHDRVVYENTRPVPFVTHFYDKISKKIVPFSRPASTSSVFYLDYWSFRLNFPRKFGSLSSKLNNKLCGVNGDKPSSVDCI